MYDEHVIQDVEFCWSLRHSIYAVQSVVDMNAYDRINILLDEVDIAVTRFMNRWGITLLRYSLGIIYIWFGALKPLGLSPAQELVENTVYWFEDPKTFVPILGVWEVVIGITICIKPLIRVALFLLFLQMPGTFLPLILFPDVCFTNFPFGLTLEGQYIVKNLIIISAAIVVGSTVRKDTSSNT